LGVVLVTGMSGTGKSTVLAELARRGHRVVDTDVGGWIDESGPEPLWREERIAALLDEDSDGALFVAGCVANQGRFYPRFDAVVLLSAPADVILDRLATRLTVMATFFLIWTLVTSFFGQNFRWLTDHIESLEAFVLYESVTLVIPTIVAAVYFWRRKEDWW